MKLLKLLLPVLAFTFASCDYKSTEHYLIDNKTSKTISVDFVKKQNNQKNDTVKVIVAPNQLKDFYDHITLTALSKSKGDNYLDQFDTIWLATDDSLMVKKDLYNLDNWLFWHHGTRESESKFTFIIESADIVAKQ